MKISHITPKSYVDGPGERTVLFLQGCPLACAGCQNKALWPSSGGIGKTVDEIADEILAIGNPLVTISGGEPTEQMHDLLALIRALRAGYVKNIIVYTGRTFEWLYENRIETYELMLLLDVLVDGPFIKAQDDEYINWRGSRNQRPIDCLATLETGVVTLLDWDQPVIQIDSDGNMHLPVGLVADLAPAGEVKKSRMCGQTT